MSTDNITCANCGKGEENSIELKSCTACKLVKYCSRDCQIAHRPMHKKMCKKWAAELHEEQLFKEPPPLEECPICMMPPPLYDNDLGMTFFSCCGKDICNGCIYAMIKTGGKKVCPFCNSPYAKSDKETIKRTEKRAEKGNAGAFYMLAGFYAQGIYGLQQNQAKARELNLKAGELGHAGAYHNLGFTYYEGTGVTMDKKKANHFFELAAMNGSVQARHNLGATEYINRNYDRAMKHYMLAARVGQKKSLDSVKHGYICGYVTKDEYATALREYQKSQDETKSDARDEAQAYRDRMN